MWNLLDICTFLILAFVQIFMIFYYLYKAVGLKPQLTYFHFVMITAANVVVAAPPLILWWDAPWRVYYGMVHLGATIFFFFDGRIRDKVIYIFIAFTAIIFSDVIVGSLFNTLALTGHVPSNKFEYGLWSAIASSILAYSLLFIILHIDKKGKLYLPPKHWFVAVISFSFVLFGNIFLMYSKRTELWQELAVSILSLGLFLFWCVLYFAFYYVCRYITKQNETNLVIMQNKMLEIYILRKQESDKMIKMMSHDLQHNLGWLKILSDQREDEQTAQVVQEYEQLLEQYCMPDIGNDIANAIINEKRLIALHNKITFTIKGGFTDGLLLSRIDLCSLLGNLLDNALEAAGQVQDSNLRKVELHINRKDHLCLFSLKNGCTAKPNIKDNLFVTQKKDKERHGIGTLSINHIVDKYDGVIKNTYKDNIFKSSLILKCYD